jgi:hypothetical protein
MTHYLVQIRLVKFRKPGDELDEWSSATSTMTEQEVSVPFESDEPPLLTTSQTYLNAVTKALGLMAASSVTIDRWTAAIDQAGNDDSEY